MTRSRTRLLVALALLALVGATPALAADYYVRLDGSDSCNGTADQGGSSGTCAFRTIERANAVANCGDTIHIGPGSFGETKIRITDSCTSSNRKVFQGSGRGSTFWMGGLSDVDESTCQASGEANVYRCKAPNDFVASAASDARYCFIQRNTNHVRFLDDNGTKGDMVGSVCVTWNTNGASDVSGKEGQVYYDASGGNLYIRPWDDFAPASADFWAPNYYGYASGADGPLYLTGNNITIRDLTVVGGGYVEMGVTGDDIRIENVETYGGMTWFSPATSGAVIKNFKIKNAYRRPVNNNAATAWGSTNSQVFTMQGTDFLIENMETYAAREGVGFSGSARNGVVNGLFAHGHHNHILKFIDGVHDIELRDVITYNGQEPVFIACAYNLSFENCSFPFSHIVIQEHPSVTCSPTVQNIDVMNSVLCGIHYFNQYGPTWEGGGHDLDYNTYMSDHAACYQNSWVVGAEGQKFGSLASWKSWDGGSCPTCTRDPNSRTDTVGNTWVSYAYRDDTLGAGYDFDLKPGANAIDGGSNSFGDGFDYDLVAREGRPDAGAFEAGSGGGGGGAECGNGVREDGEACDGSDLGGQTCQTQGFDGGTLACNSNCQLDTSGCTTANNPPDDVQNNRRTDVK